MPDPQISVGPQPPVTVTADASAAPQPEQTPGPASIPQVAAPQAPNTPQTYSPAPHPVKAALHGWQALMGSTTQYVQTPNGPQPVQVQNKPGQLFRSILAGAIMGGAAGAEHNDGSGAGYGGAARGAQAVVDNDRQQLQMRQQQGQQQFQNQQEVNKADLNKQLIDAQLAQMHNEQIVRQHTLDLQDKKFQDSHNAASQAIFDHLVAAGGVPPIDNKLPDELTAPELVKAYTADPKIRMAPDGYVRHFIDKTDASELQWNGVNWNHADGSPADLSNHTTIRVVDVPLNAEQTKKPMLGKDLNKIQGQDIYDPTKTYQVAPIDLVNMNKSRLNDEKEKAATLLEQRKVAIAGSQAATEARKVDHEINKDNAAQFGAAYKDLGLKIKGFQDQLKDPTLPPEVKTHLQKSIDDTQKSLDSIRTKLFPKTDVATADAILNSGNDPTDIPAGAQIAVNPTTGEKKYSTDGGATWNDVAPVAATPDTVFKQLKTLDPGPAYEALDANTVLTPAQKETVKTQLKQAFKESNREKRGVLGQVLRQAVGLPPAVQ